MKLPSLNGHAWMVKVGGAALLSGLAWWIGATQGAAEQVPVLAVKVETLSQRLDRIEGKLDLLLEARYGRGADRVRGVPKPVPEDGRGPIHKLPPVRH